MKNKTLSRISSTLLLLVMVGCASNKPAPEAAQDIGLTQQDILTQRMIADAAEGGIVVYEAFMKFIGKQKYDAEAVRGLLSQLSTFARGRKLGFGAILDTPEAIKTAFTKEQSLKVLEHFGEANAKFAKFMTTAEGQELFAKAQKQASESAEEALAANTAQVVKVDPVTKKLTANQYIRNIVQNIWANLGKKNKALAQEMVDANIGLYNKTHGLTLTDGEGCTIKLDEPALKNELKAIKDATELDFAGKTPECKNKMLSISWMKTLRDSLHHTVQQSTQKVWTAFEAGVVNTMDVVCHKGPKGAANMLMNNRVGNGGEYTDIQGACAI